MRGYARMIVAGLAAVAAVVGMAIVLQRFGVADVRLEPRLVADWILARGLRIVFIVVAAAVVRRAGIVAVGALQHQLGHAYDQTDLEWQRRTSTLGGILTRLVTVVVWFVAALMLLRELAIDVVPLLTGAGIAGLAIGFGAQNLVRDVISGFFLILEDQVRVGDIARINGTTGTIERVNLRTIVLRDAEGAVHVFPNGTITALANLSKQFAYAIVDVRVAYSESLDRVFDAIRATGANMQADPRCASLLLAPVEVLGVESLADNFMTVRSRFKTLPLNQTRVGYELRSRIITELGTRGIKPYGA